MSVSRRTILVTRALDFLIAGVFLLGAFSIARGGWQYLVWKLETSPAHPDETLSRLAVSAAAGLEGAIGVRLLWSSSARARMVATGTLVGLTTFLVVLGAQSGWDVRCGCLDLLFTESVAAGIARNCALLAVGALWIALARRADAT